MKKEKQIWTQKFTRLLPSFTLKTTHLVGEHVKFNIQIVFVIQPDRVAKMYSYYTLQKVKEKDLIKMVAITNLFLST